MPPAATPRGAGRRPRAYDPARTRAALAGQTARLRAAVHSLCTSPRAEELLALPTCLGGWRVRELVAHLGAAYEAVTRGIGSDAGTGAPLTPLAWVAATRTEAPAIAAYAEERAATAYAGPPAEVAAAFDAATAAALAVLDDELSQAPGLRTATRFGPMLLADYLVTRLVETVVHADDLADALAAAAPLPEVPEVEPAFTHDRQALAAVVRLLADALADRAPGGAVEVRVPPFAVVQCVEGPRHTRGTPPNVVETDPLTWVRLATGRTTWAQAVDVAQLTASGERSDLSPLLPVMG